MVASVAEKPGIGDLAEMSSRHRFGWQHRNLRIVAKRGECVRYIPTYKINPVDFVCAGTPPVWETPKDKDYGSGR